MSGLMLQLQPGCANATSHVGKIYMQRKGSSVQHHMLKDIYKEKAHQTSSPTILSTAVKAVRGAVVAVGVCIHNTVLSTEGTRLSMTTTGECVAVGVCIHNTAPSTEAVRLSMTTTVECVARVCIHNTALSTEGVRLSMTATVECVLLGSAFTT